MREFLRKNLIILLLAALAAFLAFFWLVLRQKPAEEIPPTPTPISEGAPPISEFLLPSQGNISLAFGPAVEATFSKKLPVFPIRTFNQSSSLEFATPLASALGFRLGPKVISRPTGVFWQWQEGENFLAVNQKTARLYFSGRVKLAASITETNAGRVTQDLFSSWGLFARKSETNVAGFVRSGDELEPARSLSQAEVFRVQLTPKLSGFAVVGAGIADPVLELKITREGELSSLIYNLSQASTAQEFTTRKFSQVTEELTSGRAQILRVEDSTGNSFYPTGDDSLVSANITSVELVFIELPEEQEKLLPFFLFSGFGKTATGLTVTVFLAVPAI